MFVLPPQSHEPFKAPDNPGDWPSSYDHERAIVRDRMRRARAFAKRKKWARARIWLRIVTGAGQRAGAQDGSKGRLPVIGKSWSSRMRKARQGPACQQP